MAAAQEQRLALVVGQSAYDGRPLATAANDAGLIAQALTSAGFEVVQGRDLNANDLRRVVRDFLDKAQGLPPDAAVMVYLSGYGVQLEGENYLLPVDARIQRVADVPIEGFRLSDLVRSLEGTPGQARIVVADMARDYPMPAGDPIARGLALMEPPAGFLIAFSSAPNITVGDAPGPYGHYATALAEAMRQPGVPVDEMFNRVRLRTHETTQGLETPWHKANLGSTPFVFFEPSESAAAPPVREVRRIEDVSPEEAYAIAVERDTIQDYQSFLRRYPDHPLGRRVSALLAARREAIVWRQTVNRDTSQAYWTYLRRYPNGPHAGDSRRRLARLAAPVAPPESFDEIVYEDLPPPLPDVERVEVVEVVTVIRDAPPPPRPPVYLLPDYEEDEEFVEIIREPPPPPVLVGVLPIPASFPVPRYARRPRSFYEPIAPVTPRGPVSIPVTLPPTAAPLMGGPGAPRPPRGRRPEPLVPRQPGLSAPPQPIPVSNRPVAPVPSIRPGAPAPQPQPSVRLPSRPIPVPTAARPDAARPAPMAPRPAPGPAGDDRPNAPRIPMPAAPQPSRPNPAAEQERDAAPRPVRPGQERERPAAARPMRPEVNQDRPVARPVPARPSMDDDRPVAQPDAPVRIQGPRPAQQPPRPAAPQARPAPEARPAPQVRPAPQARPVPQIRPAAPQPREVQPERPMMQVRPAAPQPAPQMRPMPRPAPAPAPMVRPQPAAPAFRPAAPAGRPAPGGGQQKPRCPPGKPCMQQD